MISFKHDRRIPYSATNFVVNVRKFLVEPVQYDPNDRCSSQSGEVQLRTRRHLTRESSRFPQYIEEWLKGRTSPLISWHTVIVAMFKCLTNGWAVSDQRFIILWNKIKPYWATLITSIEPIQTNLGEQSEDRSTRHQCLHWLLLKMEDAADTLLQQGFAHKLLQHLVWTESDTFVTSDLHMLFICLRVRRVRANRFLVPLLEEGMEDLTEMTMKHSNKEIAKITQQGFIDHPLSPKLIPLVRFPQSCQPVVSDKFPNFHTNCSEGETLICSDEERTPIDVEKKAEERAIKGRSDEESAESSNEDDEDEEYSDDESNHVPDDDEELPITFSAEWFSRHCPSTPSSDLVDAATNFLVNVRKFLVEPVQYDYNRKNECQSGEVQLRTRRHLMRESRLFPQYIEEWMNDIPSTRLFWRTVITAMFKCLTNSWAVSDQRFIILWNKIKPYWATLITSIEPTPTDLGNRGEDYSTRQQCLHWLLIKMEDAADTLLQQGFAHKLLQHLLWTVSDTFVTSDLDLLFICLRVRRVRANHFLVPLLEEGMEDLTEMTMKHSHIGIAEIAQQGFIDRPLNPKLIPMAYFPQSSQPDVSHTFTYFCKNQDECEYLVCSSEDDVPIDVEVEAEERTIKGLKAENSTQEELTTVRRASKRRSDNFDEESVDSSNEDDEYDVNFYGDYDNIPDDDEELPDNSTAEW
ncbi:hypothetical protein BLNAU_4372 [Blattamonas nauphoetae]|uniref:Uncharacterized protein n=1 Tax=Blattamonas nauphoetae TaxID=2049346 RepID=A0ABQ9YAC2_9EUKA|nr:hypothetical protein BLNAU_4372 [Blattamonas nauphoetae]